MRGDDVRAAAELATGFLGKFTDRDWTASVPGLDFTVASVVAHAAQGPLWYALDLTGGPQDAAAFEIKVRPDPEPDRLIASLAAAAHLCATAVDAMPDSARGFHPFGASDPSGFAAMACDEILVHTYDAATGLGADFRPGPEPARRVLARLFPWHEPGADAWQTLLWANGRTDLPGAPRPRGWRWHTAPLATWDGKA
ncbi:maleylpyruvate isomerase N-terminal domain-containing protein [Nonomuraea sp. NPDC046802]|uniref:maleylpyruvate isomerase N-terminal domain-containing protein n=1 Tax=Nonomuraea sp. NPDC046802 TaxID=3154919 RepID=UPI0033CE67BB